MTEMIFNTPRRIICLILFALSFFAFSSCAVPQWIEEDIIESEKTDELLQGVIDNFTAEFTIARYTGERLDPYTSENRINRDLLSLCYDPLIFTDSNSDPVCVVAESYATTLKSVAFTIDPDAKFSDGTPVTAADCVYSYSIAMDENSVFRDRFNYIYAFEELSDGRFAVYFDTESLYNVNLCDIPIIKRGTYGDYVPQGSGKYRIVREYAFIYLEKNQYSQVATEENFAISRIDVHDLKSKEELLYNFNYNKIHGAYTDITDDGDEFRGNIETISFCENSLVYLVVNKQYTDRFTADPLFSKGLTYCIDRSSLCADNLEGGTQPVWYPFNPDWSVTLAAELSKDIYSTVDAHECFTSIGLILDGAVRAYNGEPVTLRIIVNSENLKKVKVARAVASDLEEMGFTVEVLSLTWDKYVKAFNELDYDICISETAMPRNMDVYSLLSPEVNSGRGPVTPEFLEAIKFFNNGEIEMREFLSEFQNFLPIVPLYFNRGALAVNRVVSGHFTPSETNMYYGIEGWVFS